MTDKIVLAYSGGLDTSVAIPWLQDKGYDVIAACLNVGQPNADMDFIQKKAKQSVRSRATPSTRRTNSPTST